MQTKQKKLLFIDGVVDLVLGVLLLLFPVGMIDLLGLPRTGTHFYAAILGAVLLGIGLALLGEWIYHDRGFRGLGLGGAIVINLTGSLVLIFWLLFGSLQMPLRGWIILWSVALIVFAIGMAELVTRSWKYDK